ncbi:hypothetical protein C7Q76_12935 [Staphylococcus aureus]|nr:hypothetical protein C7R06_13875 [Staphylococcus aureus]PZH77219.1 hypothetical protein C7Q76_12935 [Staphylococcus aureus]
MTLALLRILTFHCISVKLTEKADYLDIFIYRVLKNCTFLNNQKYTLLNYHFHWRIMATKRLLK